MLARAEVVRAARSRRRRERSREAADHAAARAPALGDEHGAVVGIDREVAGRGEVVVEHAVLRAAGEIALRVAVVGEQRAHAGHVEGADPDVDQEQDVVGRVDRIALADRAAGVVGQVVVGRIGEVVGGHELVGHRPLAGRGAGGDIEAPSLVQTRRMRRRTRVAGIEVLVVVFAHQITDRAVGLRDLAVLSVRVVPDRMRRRLVVVGVDRRRARRGRRSRGEVVGVELVVLRGEQEPDARHDRRSGNRERAQSVLLHRRQRVDRGPRPDQHRVAHHCR